MKLIKNNKGTIIVIVLFLIGVLLLVQIKNIFVQNEDSAIYGTRLEGLEEVKINNNQEQQIEAALEKDAEKVVFEDSGRLFNIIITVQDEMSRDNAKKLATKAIEPLKKEQKKYYDIQVFVQKSKETNEFPIIGYKHHTKDSFSWTKDRTGTE